MKTIVTMTSWKQRINDVGLSIFRFFETQTVKPDIFYLWLAKEEFPNGFNELPRELLLTCAGLDVKLCWCEYNECAFKRWHVYPEHYNDLVISIDDDMIYSPDLIKDCQDNTRSNKTPHIIHYSACGGLIEIENGITYNITQKYAGPSPKNYFFGQCAFTPHAFPIEIMQPELLAIKRKICNRTDEGWLHPYVVKHNIPIEFLPAKYRSEDKRMQSCALRNGLHNKRISINGKLYKPQDVYRYMVIRSSTELTNAWMNLWPNYNMKEFNLTDDELLNLLQNG